MEELVKISENRNLQKTEENMEKIKNSLIITSYVLLVTLFFAGGYAVGSYKKPSEEAVVSAVTPAEDAVNAANITEEEEVTVYTVIMENSDLYLYRVTNGVNNEIARHKISEGVFPARDMEMLRNGVTLDNLGDAQEMFENFVS